MINLSLELFAFGFVLLGLISFVVLWVFYDRRDNAYYDRQRRKHVHHCVRCNSLYTSQFSEGTSPCPNCEFANPPLHF